MLFLHCWLLKKPGLLQPLQQVQLLLPQLQSLRLCWALLL
jgi:hypothetical protein